jgi:two-component system phosphate regulon sensor histidine kinase PhoR
MNRNIIRLTLILGVLTIIGVSVVQVFFLSQAVSREENRIDQSIQIALSSVSEQLARYNNADLPNENPVVKIRPDYYVVNVNGFIDSEILEFYLNMELKKRKLKLDFEYGIYDCQTDEIVYGNYISLNEKQHVKSSDPNFTKHGDYLYYFVILFPGRSGYVLGNLGLWYFFTGILLMVVIFFVITQVIILRQRRYSEIQKDFINNLTHEFKTPLSSISMASDVLKEVQDGDDLKRIRKYGSIIKDQSSYLVGQIDRVLHDSDKGLGSFTPIKAKFDLRELIMEVTEQFLPGIEKCSGRVNLDLPDNEIIIEADKLHVRQLIFNIYDNAVKYSRGCPEINVFLEYSGRSGKLAITDQGIGIPRNFHRKVFGRFFRVPQGNIHNVKGFGLGLHFVSRVVRAHGWKMKLQSEPGTGTTVIIYFR